MKHDIHLIHDILKQVAKLDHPVDAEDIRSSSEDNAATISGHVRLLIEHDLVHGHLCSGIRQSHVIHGLTDQGRKLLRALDNESVKRKIQHASQLGNDSNFELIMEIAETALKEFL